MRIVVTVKQVEDPNVPPPHMVLHSSGSQVVSASGTPAVMNGYDANALEEALRLKQKHGGTVTAVSLGNDTARKTLKRAIAMGADSAVLLSDPAWETLDSVGVASVLANAIRKIGKFDLVLAGRQASDSDGGLVLYWLAHALQLPVVSPIVKIEDSLPDSVVVHQLMDECYERLSVRLPALVGISSEINEPRQPSPKGTVIATRAMIPVWNAATLGLSQLSPKVTLQKLDIQVRTGKAEIIECSDAAASGRALADKLHELGLL